MSPSFSCKLVAAAAILTLAACSKDAPAPTLAWSRVELPAGAMPRDVAFCDGRWYVAGSSATRPAAWSSAGDTWTAVPFVPLPGSYYGPREVISSVACADGRVAMVGAWPGGAHGNPRVSTWRLRDGRMLENAAPFETYGGDTAVDVGRIGAGPGGFAIAGNRTSGAAAWFSGDGTTFRLTERADRQSVARATVALPDGRWLIVGGTATRNSLDQRPAAWITTDGRSWSPADPPADAGFNELQRAVRQGDDVVAAGMRGTAFGVWRWRAGTWTAEGTFGGDPAGVRSLTVAAGRTVLVGGGLWFDGRRQDTPAPPVAVAGHGDVLLMVSADALWQATPR